MSKSATDLDGDSDTIDYIVPMADLDTGQCTDPNAADYVDPGSWIDPNTIPDELIIKVLPSPSWPAVFDDPGSDPNDPNAYAPSGWSFTGGSGSGKYEQTVSITSSGTTTLTATCGTSEKVFKIFVIDVDLDMSGVSDLYEETVGGFVAVNDDDDDDDGINDLVDGYNLDPNDPNDDANASEDDLKSLSISFSPSMSVGTVSLTSNTNCKFWTDSKKVSEPNQLTWDLSDSNDVAEFEYTKTNGLYVEGVDSIVRNITLSYEGLQDIVKVSVIDLHLKFQNPSPWKDIDKGYKFLGVFTNDSVTFGVNMPPFYSYDFSDSYFTWSGEASGDGDETSVTFSTTGTKTVTLTLGCGLTASAEIKVIDAPSGPTEPNVAAAFWPETIIALAEDVRGDAITWANATYGTPSENNITDAARHAFLSCLLTRYCGLNYSIALTTAHEVSNPNPHVMHVMDLHNNLIGANAGAHPHSGSNQTCCENVIRAAITAGELWHYDNPSSPTPESALLQPTDK